jgi:lipopolysaccharide biosynthesis glycosyltransferase
MEEALKVFVGTEPKQWLSSEVLRYSITRRTKAALDFQELKYLPIKLDLPMYTGFSIYRYSIPELCGYKGKAIYLDADIVVTSDLLDLWNYPTDPHGVLARSMHPGEPLAGRYTSVMLMNCEKLKPWKLNDWVEQINKDSSLYAKTMQALPGGLGTTDFGDLPATFNHLDQFDETTKLIHYTHVPSQPWKVPGHPFARVFLDELKSAIEEDEIPLDAVQREIAYGHIYQTLLQDLGL